MAARIEQVKAMHQLRGNVLVHDGDVYTVNVNGSWVNGTGLIRLSLRLAGSYSVITIEVDCDHTFETLVV